MTTTETGHFDDVDKEETLLGVLAGAVSVCWEPRPTGVFDSEMASEFVDSAIARLKVIRANERADLRTEVQVMRDEATEALKHAEGYLEISTAGVGIAVLDDVLDLLDGNGDGQG